MSWVGIDVGGRRKGFDVAVIERINGKLQLPVPPCRLATADAVATLLRDLAPEVVAVDSPISAAAPGSLSREGERALAHSVCGIRYTPDRATLDENRHGYYDWILNGFDLYAGLAQVNRPWKVIECFPTASWTRLGRSKGKQTRARWSTAVLQDELIGKQHLDGVPARLNQDARDAIVAAYTSWLHSQDATQSYGDIVVPKTVTVGTARPGW